MSLSNKQQQILESILPSQEGRFIVKACPGSGKTFAVAHLLIDELKQWKSKTKGIAVLSFTNKASEEIEDKLAQQLGSKMRIGRPHFIGTFDNFFNNEVFFAFAKDHFRLDKEPELVGEPFSVWRGAGIKWSAHLFEHLNYALNGTIEDPSLFTIGMNRTVYDNNKAAIHAMKTSVNKKGYFTQRDATYHAYKILKDNKDLVWLLSSRYPYIVIDESQDSNDVAMAIVDMLVEAGTKKIVVIGDPDQAIYEWNNARPSLFWDKWNEDGWTKLELDESFRSSTDICSFASSFARSTVFTPADNCESRNCGIKPYLAGYDFNTDRTVLAATFTQIREKFLHLCAERGIEINTENVAILCRGTDDLATIKGAPDINARVDWSSCVKKTTPDLCKAKYCFDSGEYVQAYRHWLKARVVDHLNSNHAHRSDIKEYELAKGGKRVLMKECVVELSAYKPIIGVSLPTWIGENLTGETGFTSDTDFNSEHGLSYLVNSTTTGSPLYSTVHGVKGATFDAVLLLLRNQGGRSHYHTYVGDTAKSLMTDNTEEMRIVYVAITRPRKLLVIATPNEHLDNWENSFADLFEALV